MKIWKISVLEDANAKNIKTSIITMKRNGFVGIVLDLIMMPSEKNTIFFENI